MHTSPYAQAAPCAIEPSNAVAITREHIESWLVNRLSQCAGLDPQEMDLTLPCTAYGLDSLTGVTLVGDLELWLHVHLSPTLLWEMPSVDRLVQSLVDELLAASEDSARVVVPEPERATGLKLKPETAKQLLPHLDQLSDQDVEAMLCQLAA